MRWISCIYFIINIVIKLGLVKIDVFYLFLLVLFAWLRVEGLWGV